MACIVLTMLGGGIEGTWAPVDSKAGQGIPWVTSLGWWCLRPNSQIKHAHHLVLEACCLCCEPADLHVKVGGAVVGSLLPVPHQSMQAALWNGVASDGARVGSLWPMAVAAV